PDEGNVQVLGQEIAKKTPAELTAFRCQHLGFIFQTFNLFPTLSALDNIRLVLTMQGMALENASQRAAHLLDQVGLGVRASLRPTQLAPAKPQPAPAPRPLAKEPPITLADEPTAALDAENGQVVLGLLSRLVRDRGSTLVVVTHDNRIFHFADRILHL